MSLLLRPEPPTLTTQMDVYGRDGYAVNQSGKAPDIEGLGMTLHDRWDDATGKWVRCRAGVFFAQASGMYHSDAFLNDCEIIDDPKNTLGVMWGVWRSGLLGACFTQRLHIVGIQGEHALYDQPWQGVHIYQDILAEDAVSQGGQWRLQYNRNDQHYLDRRHLALYRYCAIECGHKEGAGRAGFSISVKDLGPNTKVNLKDCVAQTVKQRGVAKNSAGQLCDSFGGWCIEHCAELVIRGGYVNMRKPQKAALQLFDYANKDKTGTGPKVADVQDWENRGGGDVYFRHGDGDSVLIKNCAGKGQIKPLVYGADKVWRVKQSWCVPLSQGWAT